MAVAHHVANGRPVLCAGKAAHDMAEFDSIEYMCAYIRDAQEVVTINTSTSILASALRKSWVHISDSPKHDFTHPNQRRIERKF
jgi:ADP-heptose:LPS heptosyltransferase